VSHKQFGVWPGSRLIGASGRELVCAGCALYGPRTTLYLAFAKETQAVELTLAPDAHWHVTRRVGSIQPGKLFAPANLRAAQDNPGYQRLLDAWIKEQYTLRYTGGMVPDVCQLLVKGKGVFASPVSAAAPAKLRLLYEALPMAFLVEKAGGASTDGGPGSILDRVVLACDERTPVCVGSADEVARFAKHCPLSGDA
jgi:sedoheptulose-bisphosphatase